MTACHVILGSIQLQAAASALHATAAHPEYTFWDVLGLRRSGVVSAVLLPLAHVAMLFLGPLLMEVLDRYQTYQARLLKAQPSIVHPRRWLSLPSLRRLLVAPITEEFVFRACMLPHLLLQVDRFMPVSFCEW